MCKYYLTPTLLNAFTNKYESLIPMLKRETIEQTQSMKDGIEFEQKVINGEIPELKKIVEKSHYQSCLFKEFEGVMLFGYSDLITENKIYDIKFKKHYEVGYYNKSTQHLVYTYCADINDFTYIIGVGNNIFYEDYKRNDNKLRIIIKDFFRWLEYTNMQKHFKENYKIERITQKMKGEKQW